jgi:hypothetical protein
MQVQVTWQSFLSATSQTPQSSISVSPPKSNSLGTSPPRESEHVKDKRDREKEDRERPEKEKRDEKHKHKESEEEKKEKEKDREKEKSDAKAKVAHKVWLGSLLYMQVRERRVKSHQLLEE